MTVQTARGKASAAAYNVFRRSWGSLGDGEHGFVPNEDNPHQVPHDGGWHEVSLAFSTGMYSDSPESEEALTSYARNSERTAFASTRSIAAAQHLDIPVWQAEFLTTMNHEIGHTFARVAFGHLQGATETTEDRKDRRARFHAGMRDIFKKYDMQFDEDSPEAFAGEYDMTLNRSRVIGADATAIGQVLSTYGATNLHETMAEAWAEYMMDPEPRAFARDIGDMLWDIMNEFLDNEGAR